MKNYFYNAIDWQLYEQFILNALLEDSRNKYNGPQNSTCIITFGYVADIQLIDIKDEIYKIMSVSFFNM